MIKIFAIDLRTKERFEITDLYFFEEQGIHDFNGEAFHNTYSFEIFVNDVVVYPPKTTQAESPSGRSNASRETLAPRQPS